ncbi:MAG: glycosyltransferase family 4 protein [Aggregatilineales bacterium]
MRVLILSVPPVTEHGWGRYTRDLITALAEQGAVITLVTSRDAPTSADLPVESYHRILPSITQPARLNSLRLLRYAPTIRHLVHIKRTDVVHVFAEPYALAAALVNRQCFVTAHGTYVPRSVERRGMGALYRAIYNRSRMICVSRYTEAQVKAALPGAHTAVIPNGVDAARFRRVVPLPVKIAPTVLAVGQVKARKGFHVLAKAMMEVRKYIPDARAVFIGDTNDSHYVAELRQQIATDGLTGAIDILGRVPDDTLIGWYQAADVFALPALNVGSKFEGFGLAYLEASAAGLPAIGTFGCGAEEAIRDGETGLLVPQNDVMALTDALVQLLHDSDLRRRLGATGQAYADGQTWDAIAGQVLALYADSI